MAKDSNNTCLNATLSKKRIIDNDNAVSPSIKAEEFTHLINSAKELLSTSGIAAPRKQPNNIKSECSLWPLPKNKITKKYIAIHGINSTAIL